MIPVNRPVLPPFDAYVDLIKGVWDRAYLTNNGPLLRELESKLAAYLDVEHVIITANGTQALETMLVATRRAGRLKVITTPFSFIATLTSIMWTGCEPVFVDILEDQMTVDPDAVERLLEAGDVAAVLVTHLYGRPADDGRLAAACAAHDVPLLFDGAHVFGITTARGPLVLDGTATALSFHATKVFGTVEGGAVITKDPALAADLRERRSFGLTGGQTPHVIGTNAKMSELHAAFGLASLPGVDAAIAARRKLYEIYRAKLPAHVRLVDLNDGVVRANYSYAVVRLASEEAVLTTQVRLRENGVDSRRYFYPSLSEVPFVARTATPVANDLSRRILCLPLFADLAAADVERICTLIR